MTTPKAFYFLLLQLLQCLQPSDGNANAAKPSYGVVKEPIKNGRTPKGYIGAEKRVLQESNHQLGKKEFAEGTTYSIPFHQNYFYFDETDWTVFDLPDSTGNNMIVSVSSNVTKELTISSTIAASSDLIIRYQIHLTNDNDVHPSFSVFLVTNGQRILLKTEKPQELWSNSTVHITTVIESQLLFVGVLNDNGNRIAIRSFTVHELSGFALRRYGEPSSGVLPDSILMGRAKHEEASVSRSESSSRVESNFSEGESSPDVGHVPKRSQVRIDYPATEDRATSSGHTEPIINPSGSLNLFDNFGDRQFNPDYENDPSFEGAEYGARNPTKMTPDFRKEYFETEIPSVNTTSVDEDQRGNSSAPASSVETSEDQESSSVAGEVFIFFVVFMTVTGLILAFVCWRRRRRRPEDEQPVFSRAAAEHGNPAFMEDQTNFEIAMNSDKPNYKSFSEQT